MSVADPAIFQLEWGERHSCEMLARSFPPNASTSNSRPMRCFPMRDKSAVMDWRSRPRVKVSPARVRRLPCQPVEPRSCEKVCRNQGDATMISVALKRPASVSLVDRKPFRSKITVGPSSTRRSELVTLRFWGNNLCSVAQPRWVIARPVGWLRWRSQRNC